MVYSTVWYTVKTSFLIKFHFLGLVAMRQFYRLTCVQSRFIWSLRCRKASTDATRYVFNRHNKSAQRKRAAMSPDVHVYDYLKDEVHISVHNV